ncbi:hypothetical protein DFQ28_010657 [Apophysomyces sp. BC1034]|nr:hypothetical protein DFQ30_008484 [Apophysomyces sp. BC1015]KAG0169784.1 hypothetical protein DFQ29_009537 [Apophysomyces sp. BC1021]KAG0184718.1 hypothetical protein DFQ28_010657 [Apophysomyces sp. BC1034]
MVIEKIFDESNDIPEQKVVTYKLQPSQHLQLIRNVIIQRKRKQQCSIEQKTPKKRHIEEPEVCNGLPSPPIEKAELYEKPATTQHGLTELEILQKLQELREEKHRLFQLIKRLVQEETKSKQKQTIAEEQSEEEVKEKQQPQAETPAKWKNKRPSRWSPQEPFFYRQPFYAYRPRPPPLPFRYNDPRFHQQFQANLAVSITNLRH